VYQLTDDEPVSPTPFSVKGAKIAFLKTHVWQLAPVGASLEAAWEKAKSLLTQHGAVIEEVDWPEPDFAKISKWHENTMAAEAGPALLGREYPSISPLSNTDTLTDRC
jgi:Asp-tRNA(Asn)/Glu-tRNA(Gln) amidotransferase A subunit family amidase